MSEHFSKDFNEEEGWWPGRCNCGADLGMFPAAEDACDALMDHAADAVLGVAAQQSGSNDE